MTPLEIEAVVRTLQTDQWFRNAVKTCMVEMNEETTVGNVRKILTESPCRIDWEEWAVQIKTRKARSNRTSRQT
jgi:hypothetical protein